MYTHIYNPTTIPSEDIFDALDICLVHSETTDLDDIKKIFANVADINITNKSNSTPLMRVLWNVQMPLRKRIEFTKYLLEVGSDVNHIDNRGSTPLHYAMGKHCVELTKLLVDTGAKLNAVNKYGRTPLMEAVYYKDKENVCFLIGLGADINTISTDGDTNIYVATDTNNIELLKILLESGTDIRIFGSPDDITRRPLQPLHYAIIHKNKETIEILLNAGFDVNALDKNGNTPLHRTAKMCNFGIMCQLIKSGANIYALNGDGFTSLDIMEQTNKNKYKKQKDRLIALYNKVQIKRLNKEDNRQSISTGYEYNL